MKTTFKIFVLALALIVAQACGSKSETTNETTSETGEAVGTPENEVVLTVEERRAKLAEERAALEEKRRISFEERFKNSPFYTDAQGNVVFTKVETAPSFVGGEKEMMKYLNDNVVFPKEAEEKGLEGTVYVDFIIGANGVVREVTATDAVGEDVDQSFHNEAIRVVSSMPKWSPGRQNGKTVDVSYSLPVTFRLL